MTHKFKSKLVVATTQFKTKAEADAYEAGVDIMSKWKWSEASTRQSPIPDGGDYKYIVEIEVPSGEKRVKPSSHDLEDGHMWW